MAKLHTILEQLPTTLEDLRAHAAYQHALVAAGSGGLSITETRALGPKENTDSFYTAPAVFVADSSETATTNKAVSIHISDKKDEAYVTFRDVGTLFDLYQYGAAKEFSPGLLRFRKQISIYEIQSTVYKGVDKKFMKMFENKEDNPIFPPIRKNHEKLLSGDSRNKSTPSFLAASGVLHFKKGKWAPTLGFKTLMDLDEVYANGGAEAAENTLIEFFAEPPAKDDPSIAEFYQNDVTFKNAYDMLEK